MLLLETRLGDYLLHNATRFDVYASKEKEIWMVYLKIDGHGQAILGFDEENDAYVFRTMVRDKIISTLCQPCGREWVHLTIDDVCQAALHELTTKDLI